MVKEESEGCVTFENRRSASGLDPKDVYMGFNFPSFPLTNLRKCSILHQAQ